MVFIYGMFCEIFKSVCMRYMWIINIGWFFCSFKLLYIENNMLVKIFNYCVLVIMFVVFMCVMGFYWKIRKKLVYIDLVLRFGLNEEGFEKLEKNLNNCIEINIIIIIF